MAAPLCMKRMARERANLEKPNDDYFVYFDNDNLRSFHAYVIGPKDTLYEHKFVKLKFEIPDQYPLVPPKCTFIQHGGGRIHPNLYVEGKVCLSILGTWAGEPWAFAMTIETVLITVRSLLDNQPYKHEPNQPDHPQFNQYVQYGTWTWLFLDYLKYERSQTAKAFLEKRVSENRVAIIQDLQKQHSDNQNMRQLHSPYQRSNSHGSVVNYPKLVQEVVSAVDRCCKAQAERDTQTLPTSAETPTQYRATHGECSRTINVGDATTDAERDGTTISNAADGGHVDASVRNGTQNVEYIDLT